jgi:membrane-associated phospholipid phosphatase
MIRTIHEQELTGILVIQTLDFLIAPLQLVSKISNDLVWIAIPYIYFCRVAHQGRQLLVLYFFSVGITHLLKIALEQPRPFWIDDRIRTYATSSGFGLPSGHALLIAVAAIYLASEKPKCISVRTALLVIGTVCASRVIVGVHFISDVLFAVALASVIVYVLCRLRSTIVSKHVLAESVVAFCSAIVLLLSGFVVDVMKTTAAPVGKWHRFATAEVSWELLISQVIGLLTAVVAFECDKRFHRSRSVQYLPRFFLFMYCIAGFYMIEMGFKIYVQKFSINSLNKVIEVVWMFLFPFCLGCLDNDCAKLNREQQQEMY